jgi:prepilin-type N-terminal cleavage/methylation domain-containing protein
MSLRVRQWRGAFTLVELLVVIAIIGVLVLQRRVRAIYSGCNHSNECLFAAILSWFSWCGACGPWRYVVASAGWFEPRLRARRGKLVR